MLTSLPNLLTLSRIVVLPVFIAAFYVAVPWSNWLTCALFSIASLTDFFDGYFARAWQQQSNLGRFLDPVADKLLVSAAILMLVATGTIQGVHVLPAVVILMREILVSGLREFLAGARVGVPVSRLAKWKTGLQMVALILLLLGNAGPPWLPSMSLGQLSLWIAAILTLVTGYDYLQAGLRHITADHPKAATSAETEAERTEAAGRMG